MLPPVLLGNRQLRKSKRHWREHTSQLLVCRGLWQCCLPVTVAAVCTVRWLYLHRNLHSRRNAGKSEHLAAARPKWRVPDNAHHLLLAPTLLSPSCTMLRTAHFNMLTLPGPLP